MTSVVIVDDHAMFRAGVRAELGTAVDVVAEAEDVDTAIAEITQHRPDVVLLDVHLPGGGGRAVIEAVRDLPSAPRFLALASMTTRRRFLEWTARLTLAISDPRCTGDGCGGAGRGAPGRSHAELALDGVLPTFTCHDRLMPGLTKRERIERKRRSRRKPGGHL